MHRTLAETIDGFARGIERSKRPEDRKLAADYLAALASLLARATLGETGLSRKHSRNGGPSRPSTSSGPWPG
jgi:hypothetical protein